MTTFAETFFGPAGLATVNKVKGFRTVTSGNPAWIAATWRKRRGPLLDATQGGLADELPTLSLNSYLKVLQGIGI